MASLPCESAVPQVGRDDICSGIELRGSASAERRDAAIDQQALAVGEDDEQAVALADIDGGHWPRSGPGRFTCFTCDKYGAQTLRRMSCTHAWPLMPNQVHLVITPWVPLEKITKALNGDHCEAGKWESWD